MSKNYLETNFLRIINSIGQSYINELCEDNSKAESTFHDLEIVLIEIGDLAKNHINGKIDTETLRKSILQIVNSETDKLYIVLNPETSTEQVPDEVIRQVNHDVIMAYTEEQLVDFIKNFYNQISLGRNFAIKTSHPNIDIFTTGPNSYEPSSLTAFDIKKKD